ncbi:SAM-dependent methyltransferase [Blastopirellula marina]|uniref:SAM-dependent methyltransferase n=1 Tax=Blastopirellula marina TaxID=124 RepID=A0A2S8F0D3_9BACT|nr:MULTISPECIES: class I SAM-dependent methyltransferase [Pirellulaceae]PQO25374.1 SAM-dependent methyltransferase [Blastopirellula marina]RCS42338.1 class I SAM-dependent methyltransferase [Bremerella cremea]
MNQQDPSKFFDQEKAAGYDQRWAGMAPINDAQHLLLKAVLSPLGPIARVLCVGAGTGAELLALAAAFPEWTFTVVEPAPGMMAVCRQRAEAAGITSRCTFHEGYLDSLQPSQPFDAATSILVSHFLVDREKRKRYFAEIAQRLRPGGLLVNADLAANMQSPEYERLVQHWVSLHSLVGLETKTDHLGREVALLSNKEMQQLLIDSGLTRPTLYFQTLLIRTWVSEVAA